MRALSLSLLAILLAFTVEPAVMEAALAAPDGLRRAAQNITWIGKTDWQALVLLSVVLGGALYRPTPRAARVAERALRLAIALLVLIVVTGVAVQVLKYLFGRPRPIVLGEMPLSTFAPLSFQRGWNAFPSGHATTMGALAAFAIRVVPRLGPVAVAVALAVAASRVLVGAHYPADIVAGLALGAGMGMILTQLWQAAGVLEARHDPGPATGPSLAAIARAGGEIVRATFRPT